MASAPVAQTRPQCLDPRALDHGWSRLTRMAAPPWLHTEVARRMAERLTIVKQVPTHVFDWWGELGASATLLSTAYPAAQITPVQRVRACVGDGLPAVASAAVSVPAWRRWFGLGRAPVRAIADSAVPAAAAQLVWCNMGLHWAREAPAMMRQWQRSLAVDGFLMFSTLGPGTLPSLRQIYRDQTWGAPYAPWIDMHDLGDMLVEAGFADPVMDQETLKLTYTGPEAALAELRTLGMNTDAARFQALRTPRWRDRLLAALAASADTQGCVVLEFELVYGHAFKPLPRARVTNHTEVGLAEMKSMLHQGRRGAS